MIQGVTETEEDMKTEAKNSSNHASQAKQQ
jgi:hypothetical protein